jgi:O-succinylbenzoate synthase
VSSALESSVGVSAGVALAAALPELPYACGLGTVALFERDVAREPLLPAAGFLPVRRPELADDLPVADGTTRDRWSERLDEVRSLIGRPA